MNSIILKDFLATIVEIEDWSGSVVFLCIYYSPKHIIVSEQFETFFETLDICFIPVDNYNAKHQCWRSRLSNCKARALYKTIINKRLYYKACHIDLLIKRDTNYNWLWSHKGYSKNIFFN